jgi:hypothetical protein
MFENQNVETLQIDVHVVEGRSFTGATCMILHAARMTLSSRSLPLANAPVRLLDTAVVGYARYCRLRSDYLQTSENAEGRACP